MNKINAEDSFFTKIFYNFENFLKEEKKFFEEETFKNIEKEIEDLITSKKPLDINSTNISNILNSKKNLLITNVKKTAKELKENINLNLIFDLIKKSKEFFKEKNLNEYREKEENEKIRILNFYEDENFFYFGETLSDADNEPNIMEGFGFILNEKEDEFYLGNFKNDNFIKGIWMKGKNNIFLGEFLYNDLNELYKKTNFKGLNFNLLEEKSLFLFGEFDFVNFDFTGISLKLFNDNNNSNNNLFLESGSYRNNKKNSKDMISLFIYNNIKEKNSNENNNNNTSFKLKFASYENEKLYNNHYIMDNNSIIKIGSNKDNNNNDNNIDNNKYFSEFIIDNDILFRGEFKNESLNENEIKPIFYGQGIFINAKDNIRYKGNFDNGKKDGPKETLYVLNSIENSNYILNKYEGEFKSDYLIKGNIFENDHKYIENGEFDENLVLKKGSLYYEKSESYTGDFKNLKREGNGVYIYEDKKEYNGDWKDNNRHGRGTLFMEDRNKYILGEWEDNKLKKIIETTLILQDVEDSNSNDDLVSKEKEYDIYNSPKAEKKKDVYSDEKIDD
jgi:hypothetical protein